MEFRESDKLIKFILRDRESLRAPEGFNLRKKYYLEQTLFLLVHVAAAEYRAHCRNETGLWCKLWTRVRRPVRMPVGLLG
jgi:hypothetical protein